MTRGVGTVLLLALALVPAAHALYWCMALALASPEPWEWFQLSNANPLPLRENFVYEFERAPRFTLFRILYEALLRVPGSDFGTFTIVGWSLALLVCVGVARLGRRAAVGFGPWGAAALCAMTLAAFAPTYGSSWLYGARFRVFVPAFAFVCAALLLVGGRDDRRWAWRARVAVALLLAGAATFVDRTGFAVWIGLLPLLWGEARARGRHAVAYVAVCAVLGNVGAWIVYAGAASDVRPLGLLARFASAPLDTLSTWLGWIGQTVPLLPRDAAGADAITGAALLVVGGLIGLAVVRHRADPARRRHVMPWLGAIVCGAVAALGVTDQFQQDRIAAAQWIALEQAWTCLLVPVGVAGGLVAIGGSRMRAGLKFALPVVIALFVHDRVGQWDHLDELRLELIRREAMLVFSEHVPEALPEYPVPPVHFRVDLLAVRRRGLMRGIVPVPSGDVGHLTVADAAAGVGVTGVDGLIVRGATSRTNDRADLIVMTRQAGGAGEVVCSIYPPVRQPTDGRSWWLVGGRGAGLEQGDAVRLYAFDYETRSLRRFGPQLRRDGPRLVTVTGGAK